MAEQIRDNIIRAEYSEEMQRSYIDYAMSVIVSRALPDVRDGLKPVQRRTLYDMYELGIRYDRPYRKCARIVGDTMGKYHPHGDSSIYEALVVMSQEFKRGQALVDGHGNFGSIEGDGAAAMRYTEARLMRITQEVYLADLDKDVVDFLPNFDETEREPCVLPVRVPNLLINGAEGIAVGMATSIPPHNLGEVIDAVKAYIKNNDITVKGLMRHLKGPDFPTGGLVVNQDDLLEIYSKGCGKIRLRGKVELEEKKGGRRALVITEIPYTMIGANIGKFLNDVASLVENRLTTDITDISNQSSKEGIRIVLELRKGADAENLKNMLYKKTRLEDTFGVNMLAVADGRPETLDLKQLIRHHVDFQVDVCTRKHKTLLAKELEKKEIQEGLIKACDVIDLIIEILRGSKNQTQAKACLTNGTTEGIRFRTQTSKKQAAKLRFTQRQATAILEMRLYRLIGLEVEALMKEHETTLENIARYEKILGDPGTMMDVIVKDLNAIKRTYARERRTALENAAEVVFKETSPKELEVGFLIDKFGYAKVIDKAAYERNQEIIRGEYRYAFPCMNTDKICIFTDTGKMHLAKIEDLPLVKLRGKGTPIDNVSNYDSQEEKIVFIASLPSIKTASLLFATARGLIKQVDGPEFDVTKRTIAALKLGDGDSVVFAGISSYAEFTVLQSRGGYFLRMATRDIPFQKRNSLGVRGIRLEGDDLVEHAYLLGAHAACQIRHGEKALDLGRLKLAKRDTRGTRL